jgi:tetratricopeptide (TPR) repeat protein
MFSRCAAVSQASVLAFWPEAHARRVGCHLHIGVLSALLAFAAASLAAAEPPLLQYASSQSFQSNADSALLQRRLSQIRVGLSKDPPPESDCARTLGARRFSAMYDELGSALSQLGQYREARDAYNHAIECNPRAAYLHAELATELLNLGLYSEAAQEVTRQLSRSANDFPLTALRAQLDFIQEQWPAALTDLRRAVELAPDDIQATYWQCFLWLAQRREGIERPSLADRKAPDDWPRPVLRLLQGAISESELVDAIRSEQNLRRRREILSEALFYEGESVLAAHQPTLARKYFAATVRLGVLYFIEHHVAAAELAKPG